MMWYWGGGVHWWEWLFGGIAMVAFWLLVGWGIWYLVTGLSRRPESEGHVSDEPKRILDERLARGEIDEATYRRLRDLMNDGNGTRPSRPVEREPAASSTES